LHIVYLYSNFDVLRLVYIEETGFVLDFMDDRRLEVDDLVLC